MSRTLSRTHSIDHSSTHRCIFTNVYTVVVSLDFGALRKSFFFFFTRLHSLYQRFCVPNLNPVAGVIQLDDGKLKADLLRVLQDVSRSEEAIRADCLSIARRRKMSTEAITRVGTEVGVALRTPRNSGRLRHVHLSWTGDFGFWHFHSS